MSDYRVLVEVEVDVVNADSESAARQSAFSLVTASHTPSKGRPSGGVKAVVTSATIMSLRGSDEVKVCGKPQDVLKTSDVTE